MFLSSLGNRRSGIARFATSLALGATLFGSLRLGWAAGSTGNRATTPDGQRRAAARRLRPIALDADGKVSSDTLWKLFDGDAASGLDGQRDLRIRMTFSEPIAVSAVGAFGIRDGRLLLRGADGDAGGAAIEGTPSPAWARVEVKQAAAARTFVVDWSPRGPAASLSELEVWGQFQSAQKQAVPSADALFDPWWGEPNGAEVFAAADESRTISAATSPGRRLFEIPMPRDPRSIERAFLTYELDGLPHFTSVVRRLNGASPLGTFAAPQGSKGGQQIEEISPAALRSGANTVEFLPLDAKDPVGYRIGAVKLIVTHAGDGGARDTEDQDVPALAESHEWQQPSGSIRHLAFGALRQPHQLRFNLSRRQSGKLVLAAGAAANRRTVTLDLGRLDAGDHLVSLDELPAVEELTVGFEAAAGRSLSFTDLVVTGSPIPSTPAALRVTYPLHGECVNHQVHVRALADARPSALRAGNAAIPQSTWEPGAFAFTAAEKDLGGGGHGEPFTFRVEATIQGHAAAATIPIAGCVDRPAVVAGPKGPVQPTDDVGAPYGAIVKAKHAAKLTFAGLQLDVPAGAVDNDVRVTVRPLSPDQVPAMGEGMINVTAGSRAFRLGPQGMVFKKPIALSIPVDAGRIDAGTAARTYFYDEAAKQWTEVPLEATGRVQVVARTTHFTDFIAATLALPEHPGLQSLDPTSLKNIKVADPAANVTQLAPPKANSQGTATLEYPITVPPGRLGMEPHIALTYDSSRGNGPLGVGWDLNTPYIEVDTRFGVPRYDGTERYTMNGEPLTKLTAAPSGAPAGTYYALRREGKFDWIQRVDTSGGGYSWLVTDKAGVKYTYGSVDAARVAQYLGSSPNRLKTFRWYLDRAEDINGNQVNYTYGATIGTNPDPWVEIVLKSISYTASSAGGPAPAYSVNLAWSSGFRPDTFSTARPGFQVLYHVLLNTITIKDGANTVRTYNLAYQTGDFGKQVLWNVSEVGSDGTTLGVHTLSYNKTPLGTNGQPQIFGNPMSQGPFSPYASLVDGNGNPATATSLADVAETDSSQQISLLIATAGKNASTQKMKAGFEDINGDGLPDYMPFKGSPSGLAQSVSIDPTTNLETGPMTSQPMPGLTQPYAQDVNHYMSSAYTFLATSGSQDYGNLSEATAIHQDINGDGLPDIVTGASDDKLHVKLNLGRFQGFSSEILIPNYFKSGLAFDCSNIWSDMDPGSPPPSGPAGQNRFPSADVITKWVAPYTGQVRITGALTRQATGGDGMIATLYLGNSMLWQHTVTPTDTGNCTPVDAGSGVVGSACDYTSSAQGFLRNVTKGDRLYTRVNAINNTDSDGLLWDTTVVYTSSPSSEATTKEAWGPYRYKWTEANDQRVAGAFLTPWTAPFTGTVHVTAQINKVDTADEVSVSIDRWRPSPGFSNNLYLRKFGGSEHADPSSTVDAGSIDVNAGDQIHVTVKSDTPIDPKTIRVLTVAEYSTKLCRPNPFAGGTYCGVPRCTVHSDDNGSDCVLDPLPGTTAKDPQTDAPLSGSEISQLIPTYYPLQRWVYQTTKTINPPSTSLDGRTVVRTSGTQTPQLCYQNSTPSNDAVVMMIQTPGRLLAKQVQSLASQGDGSFCMTAPSQPGGTQVIFSVYAQNPLLSGTSFISKLSGVPVNGGTEVYLPDASYPKLSTYPFIGGIENMASGYHNFYMGLWNGNAPFDESYINGLTTNANYSPMLQAPLPQSAVSGGGGGTNPGIFGDIWDGITDVVEAVASFGEYIWDSATGLLKYVGSEIVDGVRWLGSLAGKALAWAFCELTGTGYTASGIRVTESHNKQEGVNTLITGVAISHGFSLSGLDLIDMNGDRYPDQVSTKGIRYAYFDPLTNTGNFCATSQIGPSCVGTGNPAVTFPDSKIRDIRHAMHTFDFSVSLSAAADAQRADSSGNSNGTQSAPGIAINTHASQGYSHTKRDLIDVNGDGLPDIVDVGSAACGATGLDLCVRLNYGYSFGAPGRWASNAWSITDSNLPVKAMIDASTDAAAATYENGVNAIAQSLLGKDPPTSKTIRLEEEGHKGGEVSVAGSAEYGRDTNYSRRLIDLVDVNGDGMPDQVMKRPGDPYRIKLNTGSGFGPELMADAFAWPESAVFDIDPSNGLVMASNADTLRFSRSVKSEDGAGLAGIGASWGSGNMQTLIDMIDIDGDGRLDQVLKTTDVNASVSSNQQVWARLNQVGTSNLLSNVALPLGGSFDIVYNRQLNFVGDRQLPWGETVKVDMPEGRWTMSQCKIHDFRGNDINWSYDYGGLGYYDRGEREFLGFAMAKTVNGLIGPNGVGNGDGSYEVQYFRNQNFYERGLPYASYTVEANGKVLSGVAFNRTLNPTPNASTSQYVSVERRIDQPYDGTIQFSAVNPSVVFSTMSPTNTAPVGRVTNRLFSATGDLTQFQDFGDLASSVDNVNYNLQYQTFSGTHFTGLIHVDAKAGGPGTLLAQRESTYTVTGTRPQLTQVRDLVIGGNQPGGTTAYTGTSTQVQTWNFTYNPADLGNLATATDPTGYKLTYTYDANTKSHVATITDSFGLTSSATYNQDFGLPATTTDANGQVVTYNYDGCGRMSKVWAPGDPTTGQPTIQMTYFQGNALPHATPWALTQHKDVQSTTGDTIDTVAFSDGLGRTIQTKKEAELLQTNGTTVRGYDISGGFILDSRGRVKAEGQPFFDSATAATTLVPSPPTNLTTYLHDSLDRVTSRTTPDGALTKIAYGALLPTLQDPNDGLSGFTSLSLTRTTDPRGNTTRVYRDGASRIVANKDAKLNVTKYTYDLLDNLATVTDPGNFVTSGTYDSLSRLVKLTSPDAGTTEWRYALTGLLMEKQTPNLRSAGQLIKYGYTTNRLTTIDYPTMPDVTYTYGLSTDTTGNVKGRVKSVTMEGGSEQRTYDAFGNVNQTTTTLKHINNTTLTSPVVTMKYTYDWLGRMLTLTFPKVVDNSWNIAAGDGEVVTYTYDKGGMLDKISGKATPTSTAENYVNDIGYDEFGSRANVVSGNGITTAYTYTPTRHWLQTVTASGKAGGTAVQFLNASYSYDGVGNVGVFDNLAGSTAIQPNGATVGVGPLHITYAYDELNRLVNSLALYHGHVNTGQSYSTVFSYGPTGNMLSKSQFDQPLTYASVSSTLSSGAAGTAVANTSYTLKPTFSSTKPHQATTIAETNSTNSTSTRTVSYDADGNFTGDAIGSTTRSLTWDEADRLKSVTVNGTVRARYQYSPEGERTQKQDAVAATTSFYFNQFLVINGSRQMTKNIFAGETRIASKTESAQLTTPVRSFYHSDNVGSTSYVTDANQNLVQHERYFPFGERWSSPDEVVTAGNIQRDYLFTGKELDRDTGFYYYGARYMDPRTSTWLSADPILDSYMKGRPNDGAFRPENLSVYSYARNNPAVVTDPTGLAPENDFVKDVGTARFPVRIIIFDQGDPAVTGRMINTGRATPRDPTGFGLNVQPQCSMCSIVQGVGSAVVPTSPGQMLAEAALGPLGALGGKALGKVAPKLLKAGRMMDHHIFPQQFRRFFQEAGVEVDKFTVRITESTHLKGVHGSGLGDLPGGWNARWADFIKAHPDATAKDIYQFGGGLMDEFGLNGLPISPYPR